MRSKSDGNPIPMFTWKNGSFRGALFALSLVGATVVAFLANTFYWIKQAGSSAELKLENIDQYMVNMAQLSFAKEAILSGALPLWNPYQAVGLPFFAVIQTALLYPFTWSIFFLDIPHAILAIQFLNLSLAVTGTIIYARYLRLDWSIAVFAGLLYGIALIQWSFSLTTAAAYCWFPMIIYLGHRVVDAPSFQRCAALSAALAMSFLGGFPQNSYYIWLLVPLYLGSLTVFSYKEHGIRGLVYRLSFVALSFFLSLGITSIQLLPTAELSFLSVRSPSSKFEGAFKTIVVNLAAHYVERSQWPSYLGSCLLVVPFAFKAREHRRTAVALLVVWTFVVLFILSKQSPLLSVLDKVPFSNAFRIHTRILPFANFAISMLVALGLSGLFEAGDLRLWDTGTRRANAFWIIVVSSACIYGIWTLTSFWMPHARMLMRFLPTLLCCLSVTVALVLGPFKFSLRQKTLGALLFALLIIGNSNAVAYVISQTPYFFIFFVLSSVFLVFLSESSRLPTWSRSLATSVVIVLLLWDVASVRSRKLSGVPATAPFDFPQEDAVQWLKKNAGPCRVLFTGCAFWRNLGPLYQLQNIDSYEAFTLNRWRNFLAFWAHAHLQEFYDSSTFYGELNDEATSHLLSTPQLLGLISVRYVVRHASVKEDPLFADSVGQWKLAHEGKDTEAPFEIYENTFALPRAYLVNSYIITNSEKESLDAIAENLRIMSHMVVLENGAPSFASADSLESQLGEVALRHYSINRIELDVKADSQAILVLTDSYYPGWEAFVDGTRVSCWRANSLFRAVEIPEGKHTVVFLFRPHSHFLGAAISSLSLALIGCVLVLEKVRRRGKGRIAT